MKAKITDIAMFEDWLKEKTQLSDSSIYLYRGSVEKFLKYNPDIDILDDYNNFLIPLIIKKNSPHYYYAIKLFIQYKIADINLKRRLLDNLIQPRANPPVRNRIYLTNEQRVRVINSLQKFKHQIVAMLQVETGLRAGDILRLKRPDGVFYETYNSNPIIRLNIIGKRRKKNVTFIHNNTVQDLLTDYIDSKILDDVHERYYFLQNSSFRKVDKKNERKLVTMNYEWYWADLKQALNTVGIHKDDFSTHDFRRCFARDIWTKFKDVVILQRALNHNDVRVTIGYLRHSGLDVADILYEYQGKGSE